MTTDSFEQLLDDIAADPAGQAALESVLDDEAIEFLTLCVQFARRMQRMKNPWQARRILADAMLWMRDANQKGARELTVAHADRGKGWGGVE